MDKQPDDNRSSGRSSNSYVRSGSFILAGKPKKPKAYSQVSMFFGIGLLEPKPINFTKLAQKMGRDWNKIPFKQQIELIRHALTPNHKLMHPNCGYMKYWDVIIMVSLLYTALLTPYEVAFLDTVLDARFVINRVIDVVFVKDMAMQFFLKKLITKRHTQLWLRHQGEVIRHYLRGWFLVDFLSILPFEIIGFFWDHPAMQRMKVIRVIRILRLLKIVRVIKSSRVVKKWQDHTGMTYAQQGLIKFAIVLSVVSHWMACVWGGMGLLLGTNLVCVEGAQPEMNDDVEGHSWLTGHSWGPDNPCDHLDVYFASLHFAVMTITSIGYGDISPGKNAEYFVGIICQLGGGLAWAYVIGSICGIIANANPIKVEFENAMDALNRMLKEQHVDPKLRFELREYLREQQHHHYLERAREISASFSPMLQGRLLEETVMGEAIQKVWYFRDLDPEFLVQLSALFSAQQFSKGDRVGGAELLCILQRGSVAWHGHILLPGDFWGEEMIVSSQLLRKENDALAMHFVEILHLAQENLETLLENNLDAYRRIRRAACCLAFRSAVKVIATQQMLAKAGKLESEIASAKQSQETLTVLNGIFDEAQKIKNKKAALAAEKIQEHVSSECGSPAKSAKSFSEHLDKQPNKQVGETALESHAQADYGLLGGAISSQESWIKGLVSSIQQLQTEVKLLHNGQIRIMELASNTDDGGRDELVETTPVSHSCAASIGCSQDNRN